MITKERRATKKASARKSLTPEKPLLFVVWIDTNCGNADFGTDWEMNSPAKPLQHALDEAAEVRTHGFPAIIMPEGMTPRPDGLFSNPATDP